MDYNRTVFNKTTGQWEIDDNQPTTITNEVLLGRKPLDEGPLPTAPSGNGPHWSLDALATPPIQPVQPKAELVPVAPLTPKQQAAQRLSVLKPKPKPKDPPVAGSTSPQSSSVPNAVGADDEADDEVEIDDQPQTMASGLPPQQTPPDAIQQKFDAQRKAINDLRRANDLANDPELARSKANNDLLSSVFASSLAQQGNTFKQDRTKEIGAIKDSFSAANKSLDSQLTEAEKLKAAAGLNEKEGGIAAAQEAELRAVVKDKLGIDVQNTQLKGLELDILVKQASKDNLDAPVSQVIIDQAKKVGIIIKPGMTNREFANIADTVKTATANKAAKDLAPINNANKPRPEQDKATSETIKDISNDIRLAKIGIQRLNRSMKQLKSSGLRDSDVLQSVLTLLPGGAAFDEARNPEKARLVNSIIEDGIRALNATGKVDAAPTQKQVDAMKAAILTKEMTVRDMKAAINTAIRQAIDNTIIAGKEIDLLKENGVGSTWAAIGLGDPTNNMASGAPKGKGNPGSSAPTDKNRTIVTNAADL